jgi:hypothetical protein
MKIKATDVETGKETFNIDVGPNEVTEKELLEYDQYKTDFQTLSRVKGPNFGGDGGVWIFDNDGNEVIRYDMNGIWVKE